ncbi:MAG: leucine-rich repeat domain-containing protein [Ruminococcus sp.]|nr:leucine-rich repeat domain-containing protein [Ruminococcus sp.]
MNHQKVCRGIVAVAALLFGISFVGAASSGVSFADDSSTSDSTSFTDGTLTYSYLDQTDVEVTSCDTSATNVSIMPSIDGYTVVSIGEEAFANCENLQSMTIPSSVTEIEEAAFYGCTALTSVTVPDSVTEIPDGCFFDCTALTSITLGDETTSLGAMAFGYCTSLEEITLPDTLTTIGDQLFYYCIALESVEIPENITELGAYMFYGCMSMTEFHIPSTLEDIGAMSFLGCQSLETVTIDEDNSNYTVEDNVVYSADQSILYLYPAGKTDTSFTVPDEVLVIYAGSFFSASNLTQIDFGAKLQYIGEMAFDYCTGLTSITIPETVTNIKTTAFSDCTGLTELVFEGADNEDGGEGEDLEIGEYAFFCCDSLKSVTLPKRVTSIGDYAFGITEADDDEDSDDVITIETDSGKSMSLKAVSDFELTGYTGVAKDYVKNCKVDLDFHALDIDWASLVMYVGIAAVIIVVIFLTVRIIMHTKMTKEEKEELRITDGKTLDSDEEQNDGYHSIVDDDDDDGEMLVSYEQTMQHSSVHQIGHGQEPRKKSGQD